MLARVQIEHELPQRPMQPRHVAAHHGKARPGDFRCRLEIQPQGRTHVDVIAHRKIEHPRRAPARHLHVVGLARSVGNGRMRDIG